MISLDLITMVIGKKTISSYDGESYISRIIRIKVENNSIKYNFSDGCINHTSIMYDGEINIYELAHKCKEWAKHNYEYTIYSGLQDNWISYFNGLDLNFTADSEAESIFKACDYLLSKFENKDQ